MFRRGPAIALSTLLSAGALAVAPVALADDGGTAKDKDPCSKGSTVKLKVDPTDSDHFEATGVVYSDGDDVWDWRFRHDSDISFEGSARADGDSQGRSFRVVRTMVNFAGAADSFVFRAENRATGEVCRAELTY